MAARAVRVALVGCGTIVQHHLKALQQSSHAATVTAVVDVDRGRAEELAALLPRAQQEDSTEALKVCMGNRLMCYSFQHLS